MPFTYHRTVRFHDTDAAGVVYFANVLAFCHEAYEASLIESGIEAKTFFRGDGPLAVPIVHAEVDFRQPLFCGDRLAITLTPISLSPHVFEIAYQVLSSAADPAATAKTRHVCIAPQSRTKQPLPESLLSWLQQYGV